MGNEEIIAAGRGKMDATDAELAKGVRLVAQTEQTAITTAAALKAQTDQMNKARCLLGPLAVDALMLGVSSTLWHELPVLPARTLLYVHSEAVAHHQSFGVPVQIGGDLNEMEMTLKKASKVIGDITRGLATDKCGACQAD